MQYESERIEYKSQLTDEIYKEVIAFANTDGGIIYIGVDDQGNATGIDDVDGTYTRLTNGVRDAIQPDVTMFVRYVLQDNQVIRIEIGEGSYKPYYLKGKGLKPNGVYVRQGASSVQASPEQIRQMIKDSDGDVYEQMRALQQDLTFEEAAAAFKRYKVEFAEDKYIALGMRNVYDDQYTNLALLLSDQCQHTTKIAVFGDAENITFKDAKEFGGSVFKQLDDSYAYLSLCNRTASTFEGLERIDKVDYPEDAIREALLNALVHRDYSFSGSIIINVNDSCMEFISIGGLLPGLSAEDIRSGISQPRNRNLAEVFHRLRLIESYGTGIRKIYALYKNCPAQPRIEVTHNTFKLILPNMNAAVEEKHEEKAAEQAANITPQMKIVLDYLKEYGEMNDEDLQELLNIKKTRAYMLATCHYTWYVPQNPEGLFEVIRNSKPMDKQEKQIEKMERKMEKKGETPVRNEKVIARLDKMFDNGWYWHGNEPCHQVAYLYDAAGAPEKTQERVHHILQTEYNDTPGGLSGNDDAGQMSAWYVFSSIGFYPVCPGTPYYYIGTPSFDKVTLNLENGRKFILSADGVSKDAFYIQKMSLNDKPFWGYKLSHKDILNGGKLKFQMKK